MNILNFEIISEYNKLPLDTHIQFDLSKPSKEKIQKKAKNAGVNTSDYLRAAVLSEDIFVVLDKEGTIAQGLIETNDILKCSLREHKIVESVCNRLVFKLNDIFKKLDEISEQIKEMTYDINTFKTIESAKVNDSYQKSAHLQFKASSKLKSYIESKADGLGMSMSQLLRISAL